MANLYTFIMEFCGGIYISQVYAENETAAMQEWAKALDVSKIEGMGERAKADIVGKIAGEEPIAIEGCDYVWSFLVHALGKTCHVDFVLTLTPTKNGKLAVAH